jgi:hypothetical protein
MLILAAVALVALAPAAHAQYGGDGSTSVSDSTVTRGQTITVTADGCEAGEEVTFFFDGDPAGTATADDEGVATGSVTIPNDAAAGPHEISNSCNDAVITVTVEVAATTAALPRTGSDSLPLAKVAIVLIAAGGLLVLVSRDRSSRKADASA